MANAYNLPACPASLYRTSQFAKIVSEKSSGQRLANNLCGIPESVSQLKGRFLQDDMRNAADSR